jgi:HlyD family secretion protein
MKIRRAAWMTGTVLVGAGIVYWAFRPEPIAVDVRFVDRGALRVTVDEDGETRVRERYLVSSPVTGRMVRLECEVGDSVSENQILARIYPLPLDTRARAETARRLEAADAGWRAAGAAVEQAETRWADARRTAERLERVAADVRGAVSQERLDAARSAERAAALALEQARAAADAARHEVEATRSTLLATDEVTGDPTLVRAPTDGRVLRVYEECERAVAAGSPILEVGDPSDLEVVVDVLTEEAARLSAGATAYVSAGPDSDTLVGTVRRIEPSAFTKVSPLGVEEQRVNVVVALEGEAPTLGDRFRVDASLVTWSAADVLKVPIGALFRQGDEWAVFIVEDGRARLRGIELGHRGRQAAEVVSGLDEGTAVVVYPSDAVVDGARVSISGEHER